MYRLATMTVITVLAWRSFHPSITITNPAPVPSPAVEYYSYSEPDPKTGVRIVHSARKLNFCPIDGGSATYARGKFMVECWNSQKQRFVRYVMRDQ